MKITNVNFLPVHKSVSNICLSAEAAGRAAHEDKPPGVHTGLRGVSAKQSGTRMVGLLQPTLPERFTDGASFSLSTRQAVPLLEIKALGTQFRVILEHH